ncbi:chondroitinase-B domain-containing protein [Psychrosphaera aquimarina]|uniref:Chondroitinase-B domain-containing protein n=1 Tax=Psychrosphaera aquimarina TaxID=2044854 RepID=A0ABU3QWT7_9GAMM|nr:chondroitinase-B domain-containing protein [Psychrosphaera aquimarina]MDU0111880.1 chondroitinase-B domain-containing protein [Psychrosphaera aquimarina]
MNKNLMTLALTLAISACSSDDIKTAKENSPAVFSGVNTAVNNLETVTNNHHLVVSDADEGENGIVSQTNTITTYGTFSITEDGAWTYELDASNSAVVALNSGEQLTDTITITSIDGTQSNIVITITGSDPQVNQPATFSGDLKANVYNDSTNKLMGKITVTDLDEGESTIQSQENVSTSYGKFDITNRGEWTYTVDSSNDAVLSLDIGSNLTDTITIISQDGTTTELVIIITGTTTSSSNGFSAVEGGNHIDGYTNAVPVINCTSTVSSISSLEDAAEELVAGDTLCLSDGTYTGDLELRIEAIGTADKPVTVAAAHSGEAIIKGGEISVRMGGEHIVLQGFVFRDGESGSSIIKLEKETECRYCRVTEVSIIDMDGGEYDSSKWIEYYGQYNRIDHNWFSGKESSGALLVLPRWIDEDTFKSSGFAEDRAQIDHNYFGNRPPAFGRAYAGSSDNEYEGVRLGLSTTHSAPSYSTLENNYFERIQGEAEVISNKSANNIIRHNTVRNSNGSIVTRHGANAIISNNFVFGDDNPFSGGIRLVDDGHIVTNNYVQGARYSSSNWNGGIVLTSGNNAGDTENGYQNVSNVFVANNTIVDSVNSLNVYGGKNDEAPKNIYFLNNIIADAIGPVIRTNGEDMPSNSTFAGNYIFGQAFSDNDDVTEGNTTGFTFVDVMLGIGTDGLNRPSTNSPDLTANSTTDVGAFTLPTIDMDGQIRSAATTSGADEVSSDTVTLAPLTSDDVGPINYRPTPGKIYVEKVSIANHDFDSGDLAEWTNEGSTGASIITGDDVFSRGHSLMLDSNEAMVTQVITLNAHTNYTLSAFMKGAAKLTITVNGEHYAAERTSNNYGLSTVSFNSGEGTSAVLRATVDDLVTNNATILNPDFDDGQENWIVVEGTGIGQVQDSSNSSGGNDGSIKFKYNSDDSGTPHNPYIAQTVSVQPNSEYKLSIYNLYKSDGNASSVLFGVATDTDVTVETNVLASKNSVYSTLKSTGNTKGDDSFYQDTLTFNSGANTSLTVFAQFKSTDGSEIRVDEFDLSHESAPNEGTKAFFDSIRLVSHPLSEVESLAAEDD